MKRYLVALLLLLATTAFAHEDFTASEIVRIYDGDTIYVNLHNIPAIFGENIGVRVRGIDTPEIRGGSDCTRAMAREVRDSVAELVTTAEKVVLKNPTRGKYFRIVADVYLDDHNLGQLLLDTGRAHAWDGRTKKQPWKCDWSWINGPTDSATDGK